MRRKEHRCILLLIERPARKIHLPDWFRKFAASAELRGVFGANELPLRSLPFACTFDNGDVTVDREVGESLCCATRLRPFYFQPIKLGSFPNAEH